MFGLVMLNITIMTSDLIRRCLASYMMVSTAHGTLRLRKPLCTNKENLCTPSVHSVSVLWPNLNVLNLSFYNG